jgi:hypothetical protein
MIGAGPADGSRLSIINLNNGLELAFKLLRELEKATAAELGGIEISPSGFGIDFPKARCSPVLPALLQARPL